MSDSPTSPPLELLADQGLVFNHVLAGYICTTCCCLVKSDGPSFRRHLRSYHSCDIEGAKRCWELAEPKLAVASTDHPLRSAYFAGTSTAGDCLPPILGLSIVNGQQCPECSKVFEAGNGFNQHLVRFHRSVNALNARAQTPILPCQSLVSNNRYRKLFVVTPEESVELPGAPPSLPSAPGSDTALFLEHMNKRGRESALSENAKSEYGRNAFLSMTEAAARLDSYGLSLTDAASLSYPPAESDHDYVKLLWKPSVDCLKWMFRTAQKNVSDWNQFYFVRSAFATPGLYSKSKIFRFVKCDSTGDVTLQKYAVGNASRRLLFCPLSLGP